MEYTQEQLNRELDRRWGDLKALAEFYADARDFLTDVLRRLIGATPTPMQYDIMAYLQYGPMYSMIQAQRSEAKTTITGIYAVWRLIQDPTTRVLIFSAGTSMSKDISNWIIQIIIGMEELACLLPDTNHPGQRMSVEKFDVHFLLKGAERSASVACLGVTSNMQGHRADLLIPDDIESAKNSMTEEMREKLRQYMKDFPSICTNGQIVYLGTPQSVDSVYNDLPGLGFDIRIWPGRYPEEDRLEHYGDHLAPMITEAVKADPSLCTGGGVLGDRGKPTDPGMLSEETLQKKELAQGPAYFDLQHMLDTRLTDAGRYPLKARNLVFWSFNDDDAPGFYRWAALPDLRVKRSGGAELHLEYYRASSVAEKFYKYTSRIMFVDPAGGGQNGDETGVAVLYFVNGYIILRKIAGFPGGTEEHKLDAVARLAKEYRVNRILVEKNFGNGAYAYNLRSVLQRDDIDYQVTVEDVWASGQKEKRIADTLGPVIDRHHLIVDESVIDDDWKQCQKYALNERKLYSLFFQLSKMTRDRDSLKHDDRIDALAGGVSWLVDKMAVDEKKVMEMKKEKEVENWLENPIGKKKRRSKFNRTGLGRRADLLVARRYKG